MYTIYTLSVYQQLCLTCPTKKLSVQCIIIEKEAGGKSVPSWLELEPAKAKKLSLAGLAWLGDKLKIKAWLGSSLKGFGISKLSSAWALNEMGFTS